MCKHAIPKAKVHKIKLVLTSHAAVPLKLRQVEIFANGKESSDKQRVDLRQLSYKGALTENGKRSQLPHGREAHNFSKDKSTFMRPLFWTRNNMYFCSFSREYEE
jgi:hypothetical protein